MTKLLHLAVLALIVPLSHADASPKKEKKAPNEASTQSQQQPQPKPTTNTYGANCKNQTASIMSGGCVN